MTVSLQGRWALVTGASAGLGADFARLLAEQGCNVVLVARRQDRLEQIAREITMTSGVQTLVRPTDLTRPDAPLELYRELQSKGIQVHVLINNAGFGNFGNFFGTPWEKDQALMAVNMVALTHLTKLFVQDMISRNEGYAMLLGSLSASAPCPTLATYAASKAYIRHLGEALNFELRKTRVRVSVACPGYTETDFFTANEMKKQTLLFRLTLMKSRTVCKGALRALFNGKPSYIPGLNNKLTDFLARFVPRRLSILVAWWFLLQEAPVKGGEIELASEAGEA